METTRIVKTGAGNVEVKKLALYDYAEFIRALQKLPGELGELFKKTDEEDISNQAYLLSILPEILSSSFDDFVRIISVVTDKDVEFFKDPKVDGADVIDIIATALELNDYNRIVQSVKKIMALRKKEPEAAKEPVKPQLDPSK